MLLLTKNIIPIKSKVFLFVLIVVLFSKPAESIEKIDSLHRVLLQHTEQTDTIHIHTINRIADYYFNLADDSCVYYSEKAINLSTAIGSKSELGRAHETLGSFYNAQGEYQLALQHYLNAYSSYEELEDKKAMSITLNSIGNTHLGKGDVDKALESYQESYAIAKEHEYDYMVGISSIGIGNILAKKGEPEKALESFKNAEMVFKLQKKEYPLSVSQTLIGDAYIEMGDFDKAFVYFDKAVSSLKDIDNQYGIAGTYQIISSAYEKKGDETKAIEYAKKAFSIFKERKAYDNLQNTSISLAKLYHKTGSTDSAYAYMLSHTQFKDSVFNIDKNRQLLELEAKFENEKKEKRIALMEKENEIATVEKKQQRLIIIFISIGLSLVLIFAVFIFSRFRITQKQKNIIENQKREVHKQKDIVELKNKEITDSINYAKHIQNAILPSSITLNEQLQNGFVFYLPKDVVSGDFYWLQTIPAKSEGENETVYLAVADCTGHGVPGAMVSVVCAHALSQSVLDNHFNNPGLVLDRTRELVIDKFKRNTAEITDGMDISLVALAHSAKTENGERKVLMQWSGANNPLWIISKRETVYPNCHRTSHARDHGVTNVDFWLHEIFPDKEPIGEFDNPTPFTNHDFSLQQGDALYLFSDGYVDQFGGEKAKKFKSANFKKLLLSICDKSMDEQQAIISQTFENWKGELEQVDDVCVIGVRV